MIFAPIPAIVPLHACETVSGRYVDVVNPNPADISLHDIAWSISRQARYAGHTLGDPYFVAQHACFVMELLDMAMDEVDMAGHPLQLSFNAWMQEGGFVNLAPNPFYGLGRYGNDTNLALMHALCHDNTEAYLVDLPSPVKRHPALREPYKALELNLRKNIELALGIREATPAIEYAVVWADLMALQIEAANLMPSRGRGWAGKLPKFELSFMDLMPKILPWRQAYDQFLREYDRLAEGLGNKGYVYTADEFVEISEVA